MPTIRQRTEYKRIWMASQIRKVRIEKKITLKCLSEKIGMTIQGIRFIEIGERVPNIVNFLMICDALSINVGSLLEDYDRHNNSKEE